MYVVGVFWDKKKIGPNRRSFLNRGIDKRDIYIYLFIYLFIYLYRVLLMYAQRAYVSKPF